jgi:GTP1/Obg family GTP-binding protein
MLKKTPSSSLVVKRLAECFEEEFANCRSRLPQSAAIHRFYRKMVALGIGIHGN